MSKVELLARRSRRCSRKVNLLPSGRESKGGIQESGGEMGEASRVREEADEGADTKEIDSKGGEPGFPATDRPLRAGSDVRCHLSESDHNGVNNETHDRVSEPTNRKEDVSHRSQAS
jgi:hypothetical protein